jgi:hypothetical protein
MTSWNSEQWCQNLSQSSIFSLEVKWFPKKFSFTTDKLWVCKTRYTCEIKQPSVDNTYRSGSSGFQCDFCGVPKHDGNYGVITFQSFIISLPELLINIQLAHFYLLIYAISLSIVMVKNTQFDTLKEINIFSAPLNMKRRFLGMPERLDVFYSRSI